MRPGRPAAEPGRRERRVLRVRGMRVVPRVLSEALDTKWTQVFHDETMTAALDDRLTHRGHVVEFVGESFRFKQRMNRAKAATP